MFSKIRIAPRARRSCRIGSKNMAPAYLFYKGFAPGFQLFTEFMKYVSLDLWSKRLIAAQAESWRLAPLPAAGEALSILAQKQFGLEKSPSRVTIIVIQISPPPLPDTAGRRAEKVFWYVKEQHHALGVAPYQYICDMFNKRVNLLHKMLRQKAHCLKDTLNARLQSSTTSSLKFSEG